MRATLDKLISWGGILLAAVLLIAGGLLTWASSYIANEVNTQLSSQHITMPTTETGLADLPAADQAALEPYAGQQLTTGPQAKAYADHYIAVHMSEASRWQDLLRGERPVHPAVHRRPEDGSHAGLPGSGRPAPDDVHG